MPFDEQYDDIYKCGIKQACTNAGAYAERVDEQIFQESILQRVYNQIDKADIIVADMTGRNPNVFYEGGKKGVRNLKFNLKPMGILLTMLTMLAGWVNGEQVP